VTRSSVPGPPASVALLLAQVGRSVGKSFHTCLEPLDLEPRQYLLLRTVGACRDQSQQAVGASLQIPPSRMVVLVDGLEERGLLERVPNPADRRAHALRLTATGRRLVERAASVVVAHEAAVCEPLDAAERTVLLGLLERIVAHRHLAPQDPAATPDPATPDLATRPGCG
jgi:DNA-binding MarR family transcriptional regulator